MRSSIKLIVLTILLLAQGCATKIMTSAALKDFPSPKADLVSSYGDDKLQFGELRLPEGPGPHPVMILIHGGCWLSDYGIDHIRNLASAFADNGIATWTLEYRRVGDEGGGWPGTFEDIADGSAHLLQLAEEYPLDLNRVIAAGHSAGGQMALWLAQPPAAFTLNGAVEPVGVLALAPAADLAHLSEIQICDGVVDKLMGGSPAQEPDRYEEGSPYERLPTPVPAHIVVGKYDDVWTPVAKRYFKQSTEAGDAVTLIEAEHSGHFEMIDPRSSTWPLVLQSAKELLEMN